ncbi:RNA polymerase sigma factor [Paenibacillus graminis]|uniref:RNA polymerase sigma factor n=1 Tax=Paenibacillus graminis TaxID=189425 RepID=UPI002DBA1343|nr:sigma-70 family RNA polymerase sigma factor [Paenibacillus graminis]MEC0168238.1 sigma-70 family RNA polymerase sigma factor [Paenibacillus graminis]
MTSEHPGNIDSEEINQVIQQIKKGDTDKFRVIIEKYQKRVYLYSYYLLNDKEQVDDAVQDIFIKVYQHIGDYTETVSFSAWIHKIAYNHSINLNKKKFRDYQLLLDCQDLNTVSSTNNNQENYIDVLLQQLSFNEKYILLLRAVEEYSFDEMGHVLNITAANARKKYERIRKKLNRHRNGGHEEHEKTLGTTRG